MRSLFNQLGNGIYKINNPRDPWFYSILIERDKIDIVSLLSIFKKVVVQFAIFLVDLMSLDPVTIKKRFYSAVFA